MIGSSSALGGRPGRPLARTAARRALAGALDWGPLALAGVAALALALRLPGILEAISWNSDAVAPAVLAEGGGGATVLGDISSAATLWLYQLTEGLPWHRTVWQLIPPAMALATAGLVGWAVGRLAGRRWGLLAGGLVLAAGSDALLTLLAPAFRGSTWLAGAILGALLVALASRPGRGRAGTAALVAGAGLAAGLGLASDPLLAVSGLAPLVGAALLAWLRGRSPEARRVLVASLTTTAIACLTALAALATLQADGYVTRRRLLGVGYVELARPDQLWDRLGLLGRGVLGLAGAPGLGGLAEGWAALRWPLAIAAVALAALALARPLPLGRRRPAPEPPSPAGLARGLHLAFWGLSALAVAAAYVVSDLPGGGESPAAPANRYLVPLALAAAATLPLALAAGGRRRRAAAGLACAALALAGLVGLARGDIERSQRPPLAAQAGRIEAWLASVGVRSGYAGYWNAATLRYHTGLPVRAVRACGDRGRRTLCSVALNASRGWYRPADRRSFLVLDATVPSDAWVTGGAWEPRFGPALRQRRFGRILVRVYGYDLARRLDSGWPDARI